MDADRADNDLRRSSGRFAVAVLRRAAHFQRFPAHTIPPNYDTAAWKTSHARAMLRTPTSFRRLTAAPSPRPCLALDGDRSERDLFVFHYHSASPRSSAIPEHPLPSSADPQGHQLSDSWPTWPNNSTISGDLQPTSIVRASEDMAQASSSVGSDTRTSFSWNNCKRASLEAIPHNTAYSGTDSGAAPSRSRDTIRTPRRAFCADHVTR